MVGARVSRTKRPVVPLTDAERLALLRELATIAQAHDRLLWGVADAFHASGSAADDLASALGLSRRAFYARLALFRAAQDSP